jgi:hypothetical protein
MNTLRPTLQVSNEVRSDILEITRQLKWNEDKYEQAIRKLIRETGFALTPQLLCSHSPTLTTASTSSPSIHISPSLPLPSSPPSLIPSTPPAVLISQPPLLIPPTIPSIPPPLILSTPSSSPLSLVSLSTIYNDSVLSYCLITEL